MYRERGGGGGLLVCALLVILQREQKCTPTCLQKRHKKKGDKV
jgi:hypothetical protein